MDRSSTRVQFLDRGPITFLSPGTEDYVDLAKTILVVRANVTKANGNDLDADEKVGIVNNFLHSLFKQVDVFLKEKQVTQATGTYAYHTYLETLLNYGPAAKESQLTVAMFYTADPTLAAAKANSNQGLLLSFVELKIILSLNVNEFCLMASENDADYSETY